VNPEVEKRLKAAPNVAAMLKILLEVYDLEQSKPNFIIQGQIINGLRTAIRILKPRTK
jgi:hypothetical protein